MPSPTLIRSRPTRTSCAAVALLLAVASVSPAFAREKKVTEQDLRRYQRNLERARKEAKVLGNQISRTRGRLTVLRGQVQALRGEIKIATAEYEKLAAELAATEEQLAETQAEFEAVQAVMDARVREAFKDGPTGGMQMLLEAESFADMSERAEFLNALQAQDANTARSIDQVGDELRKLAHDQRVKARAAERALKYKESQEDELVERLQEQHEVALELQRELREARALEKRWARKVEVTARKLNVYAVGGDGPFYACPVPNYTYIADDFGAPRVGHTHQGNDIIAPMGADIVAPFDGFARNSTNGLGGISVSVYGKEGYVYNAHASSIVKLGRVRAGEVIAKVGMTGNAQGTVPHNHFEWHPGGGAAVDPHPYLMEVCYR